MATDRNSENIEYVRTKFQSHEDQQEGENLAVSYLSIELIPVNNVSETQDSDLTAFAGSNSETFHSHAQTRKSERTQLYFTYSETLTPNSSIENCGMMFRIDSRALPHLFS
jgi:hypothetical protein